MSCRKQSLQPAQLSPCTAATKSSAFAGSKQLAPPLPSPIPSLSPWAPPHTCSRPSPQSAAHLAPRRGTLQRYAAVQVQGLIELLGSTMTGARRQSNCEPRLFVRRTLRQAEKCGLVPAAVEAAVKAATAAAAVAKAATDAAAGAAAAEAAEGKAAAAVGAHPARCLRTSAAGRCAPHWVRCCGVQAGAVRVR